LDSELLRTVLVEEVDPRGRVRWDEFLLDGNLNERDFDRMGVQDAHYVNLEKPLSDGRAVKSLEKDFVDFMYRNSELTVRANETLKVYAPPSVSEAEFKALCDNAADELEDAEIEKVEASYEKKIAALEKKLKAEERELEEDKAEVSARKREELTKHAETIFGFFTKKRRSVSGSMTKRRMTQKAQADVAESEEAIATFQKELTVLAQEQAEAVSAVEDKWDAIAEETTEIKVSPYKKDTLVDLFGVGWLPYFVVENEGRVVEMPAFSPTN
jgi:Asp-tRNA(Asn)/Glu-tRNA(Gln) amidotransferase A subunit family amidase